MLIQLINYLTTTVGGFIYIAKKMYATHLAAMDKLCRVCGAIRSERNCKYYKVVDFASELELVFNIRIADDKNDVHPVLFCTKCFYKIDNFHRQQVKSKFQPLVWLPHDIMAGCGTCKLANTKLRGGRTKKGKSNVGRPQTVKTFEDVMSLDPSKPIPPSLDKAVCYIISIKMKQSTLLNKSVQFSNGGPQPITLTPVQVPRKEAQVASKRTIYNRTKQSTNIIKLISGDSPDAFAAQTAAIVENVDEEMRKNIMKRFNWTTTIPANHIAAMKSTLNIPWNLLREIRRWLATFNVKFSAEGKARDIAKEWVGKGLKCEYAPLIIIKNKKREVKSIPWCYLFNLVGHIIARLNQLQKCDLLVTHAFIHDDEMHIKIGGDHGGGSFKMSYQVANVNHPNKLENTVIFSIFEAKDSRANLHICLERFKSHVDKLMSLSWTDKIFRCFMFGDYEFLSHMYGISGAAGKHPCLWCHITSEEMQHPKFIRNRNLAEKRTLVNLKENYNAFMSEHNGNIKFAKNVYNVIGGVFFNIQLDQVCLPGLHITLGIYLKIYRDIIEVCAADIDQEIDSRNVFADRNRLQGALDELNCRKELILNEIDWCSISNELFDDSEYQAILNVVETEIGDKEKELGEIQDGDIREDVGPCVKSLDSTLAEIGVERQAYYSNTITGNHCHVLLRDVNIEKLCNSIPAIVLTFVGECDIYRKSIATFEKVKVLLKSYAQCHNIFNVARHLTDEEITEFKNYVTLFMFHLRVDWPQVKITPKMHMLEDHMFDFISKWKTGCGLYGEQGIESAHNGINKMKHRYSNIKNDLERLNYIMNQHLLSTNAQAQIIKPKRKPRNLKRKASD